MLIQQRFYNEFTIARLHASAIPGNQTPNLPARNQTYDLVLTTAPALPRPNYLTLSHLFGNILLANVSFWSYKKRKNVIYLNGCSIKSKNTLPAVRRQQVSGALLAAKVRDFATSFSLNFLGLSVKDEHFITAHTYSTRSCGETLFSMHNYRKIHESHSLPLVTRSILAFLGSI